MGRVAGVKSDTGQLLINFPETDHWLAHPEDIEEVPIFNAIAPGAEVRVRRVISTPKYDWPLGVDHDSVGRVAHVTYDARVRVYFPSCPRPGRRYVFHLRELEPVHWTSTTEPATSVAATSPRGRPSGGAERGGVVLPDDSVLGVLCPITLDVMRDPCIASDGETYERSAIESYLTGLRELHRPLISPMTKEPMNDVLIPNRAMKRLIEERSRLLAAGVLKMPHASSADHDTASFTRSTVAAVCAAAAADPSSAEDSPTPQSKGPQSCRKKKSKPRSSKGKKRRAEENEDDGTDDQRVVDSGLESEKEKDARPTTACAPWGKAPERRGHRTKRQARPGRDAGDANPSSVTAIT